MTKMLSLVVPCYNEAEMLPMFYQEVDKTLMELTDYDVEMVFVNDGSKDTSLEEMKKLRQKDKRVRFVSLSRNFGKEAALYAGLKAAKGDLIATMDADLQDPPSLLPEMIKYIESGEYDSVATKRQTRKGEPLIRSAFAKAFYTIINKISHIEITPGSRDYRLMSRKFVNAVLELSEYNRFTKGIYPWIGFKTKWIAYDNIERPRGETKWSFWKLMVYSMEGITAFSTVPLAIASLLGVLLCVLSFFGIAWVVVKQLLWHDSAYGWSSLVCILFFLSGIQLFCIGILGQYLSKTYMETKRRPIFIVSETEEEK